MTGPLEGRHIVFVLAGEVLGGAERGALDLAIGLRDRFGARVSVCALDGRPGRARAIARDNAIEWRTAGAHWSLPPFERAFGIARFARTLRDSRPDVVVSSTNAANVFSALTWKATPATACIWLQCDVNGTSRFGRRIFTRALDRASVIVTRAEHAKSWLGDEWAVDPARVRLVRSEVVDTQPLVSRVHWRRRLGLGEDDVAAVMLAHLHPGKDHSTVLRGWAHVSSSVMCARTRAVLLLAGRDAGTGTMLRRLAHELGVESDVRFLGDVHDVSGLLGAADLAVFASPSELLPRAVIEPMAAGLAVVATDAEGTREALGWLADDALVPQRDPETFARRVLALVGDRDRRSTLGVAGAQLVRKRHSSDRTTDQFARLVASFIDVRSGRRTLDMRATSMLADPSRRAGSALRAPRSARSVHEGPRAATPAQERLSATQRRRESPAE